MNFDIVTINDFIELFGLFVGFIVVLFLVGFYIKLQDIYFRVKWKRLLPWNKKKNLFVAVFQTPENDELTWIGSLNADKIQIPSFDNEEGIELYDIWIDAITFRKRCPVILYDLHVPSPKYKTSQITIEREVADKNGVKELKQFKVKAYEIKMNAKLYGTTFSRAYQLGLAKDKFKKKDENANFKNWLFLIGGILLFAIVVGGIILYVRLGSMIDAEVAVANFLTSNHVLNTPVNSLPIK